MTTASDERMEFEWKHTREDHLVFLEYQFLHASLSPIGAAARRKVRFILFMFVTLPIAILFFINFGEQGLTSAIVGIGFTAAMFWMLVIKKPKVEVVESESKKLAKRYLDTESTHPIGTHRMSLDADVLEWCWVDGDERSSYPVSQIEEISESDARVYFVRKGQVDRSIPFHAFGDQETREAFVGVIRRVIDSRNSA